jgi:hypothetical protein
MRRWLMRLWQRVPSEQWRHTSSKKKKSVYSYSIYS